MYGFSKNERSNIDKDEEEALKKLATHLLSLSAQELDKAQHAGELMEVDCDAENQISHLKLFTIRPRECIRQG